MFRLRWCLLCAGMLSISALSSKLGATPPLTTISDTLFNADGTKFNGVVTISWPMFEASDTSVVAADSKTLQITSGILYVQLVPTTNANTAAVYTVQYSSLGVTQYMQTWAVPPSVIPLRVRDVLVAPGSVTGSAPAAATMINIPDVTGLQNALNIRPLMGATFTPSRSAVIDATGAIDGASGNLSDCLHVDGTSGPCGSTTSTTFVDAEVPGGTLDGINANFTLANVPSPASSLSLYRNGLLLTQGNDYTLSSNAITFLAGAIPQPTDVLSASYRISVTIPGVTFIDQETPAGAINGVNGTFTLSQTPNPSTSLALYRNGLRLSQGIDYTLSRATITFTAGLVPQTTDTLIASYRVSQ